MNDSSLSTNDPDNLRAAYEQICSGYQAIDLFRSTLLGLLPLASGTGIFLLLSDTFAKNQEPALLPQFLLPIGAFGFAVTLGLYFYELRGIQYCTHLIAAGRNLECLLRVPGRFSTRPTRHVAGWISELSAAHLIYAAVLGAWVFVAVVISGPAAQLRPWTSAISRASMFALAVFIGVLIFARRVNLRPLPKPEPIAQVVSDMLTLVQSLPGAAALGHEVERLQQHLRDLSQKNLSLSSDDWLVVHDIVNKVERYSAGTQ
jgi:hypothetical protein